MCHFRGSLQHIFCYIRAYAPACPHRIPGLPHHVTQRGNHREAIFFKDGDHEIYKDLLAEQTRKWEVEVWAYCDEINSKQEAQDNKK